MDKKVGESKNDSKALSLKILTNYIKYLRILIKENGKSKSKWDKEWA